MLGAITQNSVRIDLPSPTNDWLSALSAAHSELPEIRSMLQKICGDPEDSEEDEEEDEEEEEDRDKSGEDGASELVAESLEQLTPFVGSGIYNKLSAFNHSCVPNASIEFMSWNSCATLVATAGIEEGEEILITYCETSLDDDERRAELKAYGFDCNCTCLLYTSDAADEEDSVDLGGRRIT
eukprot:TRINITY_DN10941_c0_g2_i2.p1 TRINITY_DN10941_c0_g2~~TRINITY_DN10941_c0_g2_i2.p1  ORF type:complete len:182 (-),score=54.18 TRINITY_DN10941_c0_g2_i2:93-638(-)